MDFKPKAMPGQDGWEPDAAYTERVARLAGAAAEATEVFDEDELEAYAERVRAAELGGRELVKAPKLVVDFHHICDTQPFCTCAGVGSEECCCMPEDREVLHTVCDVCGAAMHAIDMDSGERLPEGARFSYHPNPDAERRTFEAKSVELRIGDEVFPFEGAVGIDLGEEGGDETAVTCIEYAPGGGYDLKFSLTVDRASFDRFVEALHKLGAACAEAARTIGAAFVRFAADAAEAYDGDGWARELATSDRGIRTKLLEVLAVAPDAELRRRARALRAGRYHTETARRRAMRRLFRVKGQARGILAIALGAVLEAR